LLGRFPGTAERRTGYRSGGAMLTDVKIRKAKGAEKPYKLTDGSGLHL
jgi:hypothetical protein